MIRPYLIRPLVAALLFLLFMASPSLASPAAVISWVFDGDSFLARQGGQIIEIRLWGVDAPEHGQPGSRAAKRFMIGLKGRKITLDIKSRDRYGRAVARVALENGRDLAGLLLEQGLVWWFRRYAPKAEDYARLEAQAKAARRGLWAESNPVPPWQWRKQHPRK